MGLRWLLSLALALLLGAAVVRSLDNTTAVTTTHPARVRRQVISSPQLIPGPPGKLNVPIPTSIAVFGGSSSVGTGSCDRDEVTMTDRTCQQLLTQGNCKVDEEVLLNPNSNEGYCAPRLCGPDRIFIFSTQLCHDPREMHICPPGRELFVSSFGTPVCQCPDGTYEGDDDLDDDVCEPILGHIPNCPPGQVFWFRKLDLGPECIPDPCGGLNLNRGPNDLPFLPSLINGRCFQMGSSEGVCPTNTWYGLDMESLKGVCADLEEYGYNVYDSDTLNTLISEFGTPITGNNETPVPTNQPTSGGVISQTATPSGSQITHTQTVTPSGSQITHVHPVIATQIISSPQSTNQIHHIQQQIGALQQQLIQLTQSLGKIKPNTNGSSVAFEREVEMSQFRGPVVGQPADYILPNDNNNRQQSNGVSQQSNKPIVIRAKLQSQFTTNSQQSITQRTHVNSPHTTVNKHQTTISVPSTRRRTPPELFHTTPQQTFVNTNFNRPVQQFITRASPFPVQNTVPRPQTSFMNNRQTTIRQSHKTGSQSLQNQNTRPHSSHHSTQFITHSFTPNVNHRIQNGHQQVHQPHHTQMIHPRPNQLQIQLQPLDFVNFQHQQNSIEQFNSFGQQFSPGVNQRQQHFNSAPMSSFQSGHGQVIHRDHLQHHGGGSHFMDSFETPFSGQFVQRAARGKRSASPQNSRRRPALKRKRRSPLPHASPSNVFESRLLGCRGGAARDINAKCRNVILPSRLPKRSIRRPARPTPPRRPCSGAFNIFRLCVSSTASAASSVNAFALG